jgi:hypothetical protein
MKHQGGNKTRHKCQQPFHRHLLLMKQRIVHSTTAPLPVSVASHGAPRAGPAQKRGHEVRFRYRSAISINLPRANRRNATAAATTRRPPHRRRHSLKPSLPGSTAPRSPDHLQATVPTGFAVLSPDSLAAWTVSGHHPTWSMTLLLCVTQPRHRGDRYDQAVRKQRELGAAAARV